MTPAGSEVAKQRGSIDRQPDEHDAFTRWLAGVTSSSSHFQPPPTTGSGGSQIEQIETVPMTAEQYDQ
jgi:hypothetical protein